MTELDVFKDKLNQLEESKSYEDAMEYVKSLMIKLIERNQIGRALERAVDNNVDGETNKMIYKDFIQEMFFRGDKFVPEEKAFIISLLGDEE